MVSHASRGSGGGPGCHPLWEEQPEGGETSARCLVTKFTHTLLHNYSLPELLCLFPSKLPLLRACHTIFVLTKVPVSSCQPCPYSSAFPALISLLGHSQLPMPSLFAMHFQLSIDFPSLHVLPSSHPAHSPNFVCLAFQFSSGSNNCLGSAGFRDMVGTSPVLSHLGVHCCRWAGPVCPCTGPCSVQIHQLG